MSRANAGAVIAAVLLLAGSVRAEVTRPDRPNILWLTSEDHGPHLGCYGDAYATTPNVDRLAARGMIYTHAWSNAPVCAPARTTLISGMYADVDRRRAHAQPGAVPGGHGRCSRSSSARPATTARTTPRKTTTSPSPARSGTTPRRKAHWKNRRPGQPFFAVFNSEKSHESQIRTRPHTLVHDPAKVRVPAYHPDTPEVRHDWAQYYDGVSAADADAGRRLEELEQDGLADDTIVFYFADHGSGMPRSKRWPYNSGLHVPLVVYIPEKWRHLAPPDYTPGRQVGPAGELRRLRAHGAEPGGHPAAGLDAGPRLPRASSPGRRSRSSSASAAGWTSATTWSAA